MKNRWVKLMKDGRTCYGQIAGCRARRVPRLGLRLRQQRCAPGQQALRRRGHGCLARTERLPELRRPNGEGDRVDWQFVEEADVPNGPWKKVHSSDNRVIN